MKKAHWESGEYSLTMKEGKLTSESTRITNSTWFFNTQPIITRIMYPQQFTCLYTTSIYSEPNLDNKELKQKSSCHVSILKCLDLIRDEVTVYRSF